MKLAVSNIAWSADDRHAAYKLLSENGVTGLEIAPGLFLWDEDDPFLPSESSIKKSVEEIQSYNLKLVSMQSLLFGVEGAELFGPEHACGRFKNGMERAIRLGAQLECPNLVFGSPRQRIIPAGMELVDANKHAIEVFRNLGDLAESCGVKVAIEPNPSVYGTNFLNTITEAAGFVEQVQHRAISLNFDTGAIYLDPESPTFSELVEKFIHLVSHVHLSEPQLAPAPVDTEITSDLLSLLRAHNYTGWQSIEMKASASPLSTLENSLHNLKRAVQQANEDGRQ